MTTDIIDDLDIDKILNLSDIDDSFEKTTAPLGLYRKSDHILSNVNLTPFSEKRSVEKIYNALKEIITAIVAKCNSLQEECNELQDNTTKLRNDILDIYDRCKDSKQITLYQLESIKFSYELYKKLKGNSFVEEIVKRVEQFEIID
jgi:peptidoglycan hydrolase CwlO-like protein